MRRAVVFSFLALVWACTVHAQTPRTFFGMHINCIVNDAGDCPNGTTPWPSFPVGTIRSWDTGVIWSKIETSNGVYNWTKFDELLNKAAAHGAEIVFTLGGTPNWAATNPSDPNCSSSYLGAGSCSPPTYNGYWTAWVTAVVRRAAGRIKYWEIWNEPNGRSLWDGTVPQLVKLCQLARTTIKAADPSLQVVSPPPAPEVGLAADGDLWMARFFSEGGDACVDIIGYHSYPAFYTSDPVPVEQMSVLIQRYRNVMATYGLDAVPLWNTEGSWLANSQLTSTAAQADFVVKYSAILLGAGVGRSYWYAYDDNLSQCPSGCFGTLWSGEGTILGPAGTAYKLLEQWLLNSKMTNAVARVLGANTIRNNKGTGALSGTPGKPPSHWLVNAPDVVNGITTNITTGNGYIDWRVRGTATSSATGTTQMYFENDSTIACSGAKQQWWFSINTSLVAGSYNNVISRLVVQERGPDRRYLADDQGFSFTATRLAYTSQVTSQFSSTTMSSCAFVVPLLSIHYDVGKSFDITLRLSNPNLDNGTQWRGAFIGVDGTSAILAWDGGNGSRLTDLDKAYANYQDDKGIYHPVIDNSVTLTQSPMWITAAPIGGLRQPASDGR